MGVWKRIGRALSAAIITAVCCAWIAGPADANTYLPPRGKVFAGLTGGTSIVPWESLTGHHPPVFDRYAVWNAGTAWMAHPGSGSLTRSAVHLSTAVGHFKPAVISTEAIALGHSDRFLVAMNQNIAHSGRIVYIRIMGEMNGYWNAYCPYNRDGSSRGRQYSAHFYIEAWRRTVLILRGGPVATIDHKLRALGLPRITAPVAKNTVLPRPKVTFTWTPQTQGDPNIRGNQPSDFWPGSQYVDWVGTDFYSGDNFSLLNRFYKKFSRKPFEFGEWGVIGSDDPAFVKAMFSWVRTHPRVRMFNYYQGYGSTDPSNLARYPKSRAVLTRELTSAKFPQYAPEYATPTITITSPKNGVRYARRSRILAAYTCTEGNRTRPILKCTGSVPKGKAINTSTLGKHSFTVTATDTRGNTTSKTVHYTVIRS